MKILFVTLFSLLFFTDLLSMERLTTWWRNKKQGRHATAEPEDTPIPLRGKMAFISEAYQAGHKLLLGTNYCLSFEIAMATQCTGCFKAYLANLKSGGELTNNPLNKYNAQGFTLLHLAIIEKSTSTVKEFIEAGADKELKVGPGGYYEGRSPADLAVVWGAYACYAELLRAGAKVCNDEIKKQYYHRDIERTEQDVGRELLARYEQQRLRKEQHQKEE